MTRYRGLRRRVTGGERVSEPNQRGAVKFRLQLECGHTKEAWYVGSVPSVVSCQECKPEPEKR